MDSTLSGNLFSAEDMSTNRQPKNAYDLILCNVASVVFATILDIAESLNALSLIVLTLLGTVIVFSDVSSMHISTGKEDRLTLLKTISLRCVHLEKQPVYK